MARITFFGPLGAGHVNPTLGIVTELVRRGHVVTYAAPEMFADRIAETGARFTPVASTWEAMGRDTVPQMHGRDFVRAMGLLLDETMAMVEQLAHVERPDVVIHDGTLAWWGRILAQRWQVPAVETWPNFVGNRHWNMGRYVELNPLSVRFLRTSLRLARYLRRHGIRDVGGFLRGASAALRIVTIPRALQPAGDTFDAGYLFTGPTLTERAYQGNWRAPGNVRVLFVSLGTAYNDRPEFFRMIAGSAAGRAWHVVMSIGGMDPAGLGSLPPNVEAHAQVPQLAVLDRADAFVTHAGMGSALEGIAFEVPLIAVPQMAEQRANTDRLTELGLAIALDPGSLRADALWGAVERANSDATMRDRLSWMRKEIEAAGGAAAAADGIENVLPR